MRWLITLTGSREDVERLAGEALPELSVVDDDPSHESALELHGLSDVLPNTVHLLVGRGDRGLKPPGGVTLHTTTRTLEPAEVVKREGIRATAPARSVVDAARAGTAPEQIESAVQQALAEGLVTPGTLLAQLGRRAGGGIGQLVRQAVGDGVA